MTKYETIAYLVCLTVAFLSALGLVGCCITMASNHYMIHEAYIGTERVYIAHTKSGNNLILKEVNVNEEDL